LAVAMSAPQMAAAQQAPPSAASIEAARTLYNEGKDLRSRGDIAGALAKFKAAHELGRTPITGVELARTQAAQGQLLEARETCLGVARIPVTASETERSGAARQEAAQLAEELRPRIPSLLVRLQNVPPGSSPIVTIDRVQVPVAALTEPFKVNPGRHEVSARLPRGQESFLMVDLGEGQTREVILPVAAEPPMPAGGVLPTYAPPPQYAPQQEPIVPPPPGQSYRTRPLSTELVVTGAVIGGAGFILGAIFGGLTIDRTNYVREHCPNHRCPPYAHDELDAANSYGLVTNVSLIVGGVGLLVAGIGATPVTSRNGEWSTAPRKTKPSFRAGPTGIHGTF
jgi:hypothetical protein